MSLTSYRTAPPRAKSRRTGNMTLLRRRALHLGPASWSVNPATNQFNGQVTRGGRLAHGAHDFARLKARFPPCAPALRFLFAGQ